jgi:hypothetical protein
VRYLRTDEIKPERESWLAVRWFEMSSWTRVNM